MTPAVSKKAKRGGAAAAPRAKRGDVEERKRLKPTPEVSEAPEKKADAEEDRREARLRQSWAVR